jgi:CRP-like cAMP-binding protein
MIVSSGSSSGATRRISLLDLGTPKTLLIQSVVFTKRMEEELTMSENERPSNLLLAALPETGYRRLLPQLELVELKYQQRLYGSGDTFSHVYFIESGIVSILVGTAARSTIELAMIGREGLVGLPVFLGVKVSNNRAVVQGEGSALRMTTRDFLTACAADDDLSRVLRAFTYSMMVQISRATVCNRFHPIDARLARWLLITQDRMRSADFEMTQEALSDILGVRREAVNKVATNFQKRSLISYVRGKVKILDRTTLESLACECYTIVPNI